METKLEKELLDKIDNLPSGSEEINELSDSLGAELLTKIDKSADDLIRFALFESLSPIEDYSYAIEIMKEHYTKYNDFRIAVLISYWSSVWESYKENDFIPVLDEFLENATDEQKSIIFYLKALDLSVRSDLSVRRSRSRSMREYKGLLEKSIYYNDKSFFNFYKLSLVAEKHHAKNILRKGFLNIKRISTVQDLQEMKIREFLDYDRYLNEFILGTEVDEFSYKDIEAYYNSL